MHRTSIWQSKQSMQMRTGIVFVVLILCSIVGLAHHIPTHLQAYAQDTKGMPANVSSLSLVLQDCDHLLQHDTVVEIRFYGLDIGAFGGIAQWNTTPLQLYGRREMVGLIQPHGAEYRIVFYNPSIDWRAQEVQYTFFNPDSLVNLTIQPRQWSFDHTDGSIWHWHVCTAQDTPENQPDSTPEAQTTPTAQQTTETTETTETAETAETATPTALETTTPTDRPTETPSAPPTDSPTTASVESVEPTAPPTAVEPTVTPIVILTQQPTTEPTVIEPTETPIIEPTETPIIEPTEAPIIEPTEAPIIEPTEAPIIEPTAPPSEEMPINVGVAPGLAGPDEKVAFFISGLRAHDTLRYHLIDPSGNIHSDDDFKTGTTPEGRADWTWKVPTEPIPGVWTIVIEAQYTEVTEEIPFEIYSGE